MKQNLVKTKRKTSSINFETFKELNKKTYLNIQDLMNVNKIA
jgi:hypothetical protein